MVIFCFSGFIWYRSSFYFLHFRCTGFFQVLHLHTYCHSPLRLFPLVDSDFPTLPLHRQLSTCFWSCLQCNFLCCPLLSLFPWLHTFCDFSFLTHGSVCGYTFKNAFDVFWCFLSLFHHKLQKKKGHEYLYSQLYFTYAHSKP
jgi:hypothetical protein